MKKIVGMLSMALLFLAACSKDNGGGEEPNLDAVVVEAYKLKPFVLEAKVGDDSFEWKMGERVVSNERQLSWFFESAGEQEIYLTSTKDGQKTITVYTVKVLENTTRKEIAKIFDFMQAPGQQVNKLPEWLEGNTRQDIIAELTKQFVGKSQNESGLVSLGAYGGFIVFGFDHVVVNRDNLPDFKVFGNAYENASEPGIVMVSYDANANGLPDDAWYELAGSEYRKPETVHNYEITYTRPNPLDADVAWTDNQDSTGFVYRIQYHKQASYYPLYTSAKTLTFSGTKLKNNAVVVDGIHKMLAYDWGYADNKSNETPEGSDFDIAWAVDAAGNPVQLRGINFVKVYTALNQDGGWLGETSTDFAGAEAY